jgi:cytoskeletal protein CcmA (bactofilin family)
MTGDETMDGDLAVDEDLDFSGIVRGSITVNPGGSLHLTGRCEGNLLVKPGAHAVVSGTVGGNLANQGIAEVWGEIRGDVVTSNAEYWQSPDAVVRGAVRK